MSLFREKRLYFREPIAIKKGKVILPNHSKIDGRLNELRFRLDREKLVRRNYCGRSCGYGAVTRTSCIIIEAVTEYNGYYWTVSDGGGKDKLTLAYLDELKDMAQEGLIEELTKEDLVAVV